jgi:hypothetical protein
MLAAMLNPVAKLALKSNSVAMLEAIGARFAGGETAKEGT